jgi:N-acetylmuramoyl-L-alanine amidase
VTRQRQSKEPYFRWGALDWLQRTSATVAVLVVLAAVALLAYSFVGPARAGGAPGRPHAPAPLAIFIRPTSAPRATLPGPTPIPTVAIPRIGIVSGHHGNDSGAVCPDGLTEASVNYDIANRVAGEMRQRGYRVDVLDEFDPRLNDYRALLLLSIHADSCDYINDEATGFKVAHVLDSRDPEQEDKLVQCISDRYAARTGLRFHKNSVTRDMTNYHGFYEVAPDTPAAIIETGFLRLDRAILTQRADLVAQGIIDGLMCYLSAQSTP